MQGGEKEQATKVAAQQRRQAEGCIREVTAGLDPNTGCQLMWELHTTVVFKQLTQLRVIPGIIQSIGFQMSKNCQPLKLIGLIVLTFWKVLVGIS